MPKLCINSTQVEEGDIFIAIPCKTVNANIRDAKQRGAALIIAQSDCATECENCLITNDVRLVTSKLAAFSYPEFPDTCVAITGTNGKSSVSFFTYQFWTMCKKRAAMLGTNGLVMPHDIEKIDIPNLTTPDAFDFHRIEQYLAKHSITHFVFEASSHALDQKRIHSAKLCVAAMTNLGVDHLDYHKSHTEYFAAKKRLFSEIGARYCVFSRDDAYVYDELSKICKDFVTFGFADCNDIVAKNIRVDRDKTVCDFICFGKNYNNVKLNVIGDFQVQNILCSIAIAVKTGINIDQIMETIHQVLQLNGRMEKICTYNDGEIYVDFAHTINAFATIMETFRKLCANRLIVVFGCGGDRDSSKRPIFAKIASKFADVIIVTDDNPRTESPENIRQEIVSCCNNAINIGDRVEAINKGIKLLQKGDILVVVGRGDEKFQIYKDKTIKNNDKDTIINICKNLH